MTVSFPPYLGVSSAALGDVGAVVDEVGGEGAVDGEDAVGGEDVVAAGVGAVDAGAQEASNIMAATNRPATNQTAFRFIPQTPFFKLASVDMRTLTSRRPPPASVCVV